MDDLEIARLVEKSQIDATSALAKIWLPLGEGGAGFETEGSYMNRACGLGMHGPVDGADLDRLTAFFEERGAEAQVHASAYADDSLFAGLAARGFVLRHIEHLFAREIVAGDDFSATGPPEGVRVERVDVTDEPALHAYLAMSESGFSPDLAALGDAYQDTGVRAARLPNTDAFVARLEGRVVGRRLDDLERDGGSLRRDGRPMATRPRHPAGR